MPMTAPLSRSELRAADALFRLLPRRVDWWLLRVRNETIYYNVS